MWKIAHKVVVDGRVGRIEVKLVMAVTVAIMAIQNSACEGGDGGQGYKHSCAHLRGWRRLMGHDDVVAVHMPAAHDKQNFEPNVPHLHLKLNPTATCRFLVHVRTAVCTAAGEWPQAQGELWPRQSYVQNHTAWVNCARPAVARLLPCPKS